MRGKYLFQTCVSQVAMWQWNISSFIFIGLKDIKMSINRESSSALVEKRAWVTFNATRVAFLVKPIYPLLLTLVFQVSKSFYFLWKLSHWINIRFVQLGFRRKLICCLIKLPLSLPLLYFHIFRKNTSLGLQREKGEIDSSS